MRALAAASALLAVGLVLTGCSSGPREAALGESLVADVRGTEIDATANMTVTAVERLAMADVADELQLGDSYSDGTVFLVQYDAQIAEGEFPADDTYAFGSYNWAAVGVDDVEIAVIRILGAVEVPGCDLFDSDDAAALAAGEQISSCVIFASEQADAQLESVIYGQKSITRRGAPNGWTWNLEG